MKTRTAQRGCMAAAVALAMLQLGAAQAQSAGDTASAAPADGLNLERIVVTGTTGGTSKMKSSNSVSSMELDTILHNAPTSARSPALGTGLAGRILGWRR